MHPDQELFLASQRIETFRDEADRHRLVANTRPTRPAGGPLDDRACSSGLSLEWCASPVQSGVRRLGAKRRDPRLRDRAYPPDHGRRDGQSVTES